jgi:hypothetical protein
MDKIKRLSSTFSYALVIGLCFLLSCKKPIDYNEGYGYVIGRETCFTDSTKNAWLISFVIKPAYQSELVTDSIIYQGKTFQRVVRSYNPIQSSCLKKSQSPKGQDYCYFRFHTLTPKRFACDAVNSYNIPEITDLVNN